MFSLEDLGFTDRAPEYASWRLGFGLSTCDISAEPMMNLSIASIVQVSGLLRTPRVLAIIDVQLPQDLNTPEEAAAWLVFGLQRFQKYLGPLPPWWALGEANLHRHPIVQKRLAAEARSQAWEARPQCRMNAEHARLFRRELRQMIERLEDDLLTYVNFDGEVLRLHAEDRTIRAFADGEPWPVVVQWKLDKLMTLPARFRGDQVSVGYFDGKLDFDGCRYEAEGLER